MSLLTDLTKLGLASKLSEVQEYIKKAKEEKTEYYVPIKAEMEDLSGTTIKVTYFFFSKYGGCKVLTVSGLKNLYFSKNLPSIMGNAQDSDNVYFSFGPAFTAIEGKYTETTIVSNETLKISIDDIEKVFGRPIEIIESSESSSDADTSTKRSG